MAFSPLANPFLRNNPFIVSGGVQAMDAIPDLEDEDMEGMLERIGGSVLSGIATAGMVLDTPRAIVANILTGNVPWQGVFEPDDRITGREMLTIWGLTAPNDPNRIEVADFAGFFSEVLTDPLLGVGGPTVALTKKGITQGLKGGLVKAPAGRTFREVTAKKGAREVKRLEDRYGRDLVVAAGPQRMADEIRKGQRALVSWRMPGVMDEPVSIFTGPKAAKAFESLFYNPISQSVRSVFSQNPWLRGVSKDRHRAADREFARWTDNLNEIHTANIHLMRRFEGMEKFYDTQVKEFFKQNPDQLEKIVQNTGVSIDDMTQSDFIRALGENPHIQQIVKEKQKLTAMRDLSEKITGDKTFGDLMSDYDDLVSDVLNFKDGIRDRAKHMGLPLSELDDEFIGHLPRQIDEHLKTLWARAGQKAGAKGRLASTFFRERKDTLRNVPGGTNTLNRISKDPQITALGEKWSAIPETEQAAAIQKLKEIYHVPPAVDPATGMMTDDNIEAMARFFAALPPSVVETGLFSRHLLKDIHAYTETLATRTATLEAIHDMFVNAATTTRIGPSVAQVMTNHLGLNKHGKDYLTLKYAAKHGAGLKHFQFDPSRLFLPEESITVARRFLDVLRNPQKEVDGFTSLFDKYMQIHKFGLTLPYPAFHTRNFLGGQWMNWVTAFRNPAQAIRANAKAWQLLQGKKVNVKGFDVLEEMRLRGGIDEGLKATMLGDIGIQAGQATPVRSLPSAVFNPATAMRRAKERYQKGGFGPLNPFRREFTETEQEALTTGLGQWGVDSLHLVEFQNRASHVIAQLENGMKPAAAVMSSLKAHFDYSALTKGPEIQAGFLRRLFPFYGWLRNNSERMAIELINKPGGDQPRPSYLREQIAIPLGTTMKGGEESNRFLRVSRFLGIEDFLNYFPTKQGLPYGKRMIGRFMAQMNPLVQYAAETATGTSLWSGRELSSMSNLPFESQAVSEIFNKSALARAGNLYRTARDPRKTVAEKAASFLFGGAKVTNISPEAVHYDAKRVIEDFLGPDRDVRKFSKLYIRPEDVANLTDEQLRMFSLYRWLDKKRRERKRLEERYQRR
jgi:hypothetical protein